MKVRETEYDGKPAVEVTFVWVKTGEECQDCGLPAAFADVYVTGPGAKPPNTTVLIPLCAVCAANHAADDATIIRTFGMEDFG